MKGSLHYEDFLNDLDGAPYAKKFVFYLVTNMS
jgi:hypothetical protein